MCLKIRCDGESEKFCKIFLELNKALLKSKDQDCLCQPPRPLPPAPTKTQKHLPPPLITCSTAPSIAPDAANPDARLCRGREQAWWRWPLCSRAAVSSVTDAAAGVRSAVALSSLWSWRTKGSCCSQYAKNLLITPSPSETIAGQGSTLSVAGGVSGIHTFCPHSGAGSAVQIRCMQTSTLLPLSHIVGAACCPCSSIAVLRRLFFRVIAFWFYKFQTKTLEPCLLNWC